MARSLGSPSNMSPLSGPPASSEQHGQANGRGRGHSATAATAPTSLVARSEVGLAAEQASSARSFASMTSSRSTNTRRDDDPVVIPDHTSEVGTVVQPYSGAPSCVVEADDPYSCSFTEADVSHVTAHLQRRAMVSFILLFGTYTCSKKSFCLVFSGEQLHAGSSVLASPALSRLCSFPGIVNANQYNSTGNMNFVKYLLLLCADFFCKRTRSL